MKREKSFYEQLSELLTPLSSDDILYIQNHIHNIVNLYNKVYDNDPLLGPSNYEQATIIMEAIANQGIKSKLPPVKLLKEKWNILHVPGYMVDEYEEYSKHPNHIGLKEAKWRVDHFFDSFRMPWFCELFLEKYPEFNQAAVVAINGFIKEYNEYEGDRNQNYWMKDFDIDSFDLLINEYIHLFEADKLGLL